MIHKITNEQDCATCTVTPPNNWLLTLGLTITIAFALYLISALNLNQFINISESSTLTAFFIFGLTAGLSSCAAIVGGLVLSLSEHWHTTTPNTQRPLALFLAGRLTAFFALGGLLGLLGSFLTLSVSFAGLLTLAVALYLLAIGLKQIGIPGIRNISFVPKFFRNYFNKNTLLTKGRIPFLTGAATFFLPCGFTIAAQSIALVSGSFWRGALVMLFFSLGTTPTLIAIGSSSSFFYKSKRWSSTFSKVSALLLIFFSLYTINNQLNVLGFLSFTDIKQRPTVESHGLAPIVQGKHYLVMEVSSQAYNPNYFKVKAGIPIHWEILEAGASGCTRILISRDLFPREKIILEDGQTTVKEFTIDKPGKYKFSCSMGMVIGEIEAI